jgi:hypothetical protein
MRSAAACVRRSRGGHGKFQFEIICGSEKTIDLFHRTYYRRGAGGLAPSRDPDVLEADRTAERFIRELSGAARTGIATRVRAIPKTQFAVVGNVVFEFILDAPGRRAPTEINRARRIEEAVTCNRFAETFKILKQLPRQ